MKNLCEEALNLRRQEGATVAELGLLRVILDRLARRKEERLERDEILTVPDRKTPAAGTPQVGKASQSFRLATADLKEELKKTREITAEELDAAFKKTEPGLGKPKP